MYTLQNCNDFRDLPSRNPVTKQNFDLVNNRAEFEGYLNNCPPFTDAERIGKYDEKFCNALFSNLDQNGNTVDPWTGQAVSINNAVGGISQQVLTACGFREHNPVQIPYMQIDCNTADVNNCVTFQPENNRDNMNNWIQAQHRYINNLQRADRDLITDYESMDSFRWNNVFRGLSKPCDAEQRETPDEFAEKFQRLYNLILKAPRTPRMYVFRGVRTNNLEYFDKEQDDKIVQMKGFTSYTIDMNSSTFYAYHNKTINPPTWNFDNNLNNGKINILEIPVGTPALFVSSRPGDVIERKYELVLLPHTVKFLYIDRAINIPNLRAGPDGPPLNPTPANPVIGYVYKYMSSTPLTTYFPKGLDTISSESLINYFVDYCKNSNVNRNEFLVNGLLYPSVIKGGFGITKLLNHRYRYINLIPTGDLDLEVYCNAADFNTKVNDVNNFLTNFINSLTNKFPATDLTNRVVRVERNLVANSETLCSIQFTPCGNKTYNNPPAINVENIIDIKITVDPNTFNMLNNPAQIPTILDIGVSNYLDLPIKNIEAYLLELKDLLRRTIRPRGNANNRNPYVGDVSRRNKGRKTLERTKTLCSISVAARNNPQLMEMCKILSRLSMKQILPDSVNDIQSALDLNARFGNSLDP